MPTFGRQSMIQTIDRKLHNTISNLQNQVSSITSSDVCTKCREEYCRQSPININFSNKTFICENIHNNQRLFSCNYNSENIEAISEAVHNNYHFDLETAHDISFNGETFRLKQYHFHKASEHTLNCRTFPMEIHYVHQKIDIETGLFSDHYLVIGIFISPTATVNGDLSNALKVSSNDQSIHTTVSDLNKMSYFFYPGSLTTDPFSSTVTWLVMKDPIYASSDDINNWNGGSPRPVTGGVDAAEVLYFEENV